MISSNRHSNIKADEISMRLAAGELLPLLDVREPIEFQTFNIGGKNIPLSKLSGDLSSLGWNKDEEIIVICKIGLRSRTAKSILQKNGYQNVRNLEGGLIGLRRAERRKLKD